MKRLLPGVLLACTSLVAFVFLHHVYGLVPIRCNESLTSYSGLRTESNVLCWITGWTDYSAYFRFHESDEWAQNSAKKKDMKYLGVMSQERCIGASAEMNPWWFNIGENSRGDCWQLTMSSFRHILFYDSASQVSLLRSFSW